jgi:hypothetical protein
MRKSGQSDMRSMYVLIALALTAALASTRVALAQQAPVQRHLTDNQKSALKRGLAGMATAKAKVRIVCLLAVDETEPCDYALDFAQAFKAAGWTIDGGNMRSGLTGARFLGHPQIGTFFLVSADDAAKKTIPADTLKTVALLKSNNVAIVYQSSDDVARGMFEIRVLLTADYWPGQPR